MIGLVLAAGAGRRIVPTPTASQRLSYRWDPRAWRTASRSWT